MTCIDPPSVLHRSLFSMGPLSDFTLPHIQSTIKNSTGKSCFAKSFAHALPASFPAQTPPRSAQLQRLQGELHGTEPLLLGRNLSRQPAVLKGRKGRRVEQGSTLHALSMCSIQAVPFTTTVTFKTSLRQHRGASLSLVYLCHCWLQLR